MNKNQEVTQFLTDKKHPMTPELERVREIILSTDPAIKETIKWSSPTFMYKGNIASFFLNAKKFVSLMFHQGAHIPDPNGLLQGDSKTTRMARFQGMEDIENKKEALQTVIRNWMILMDEEK